jgi:hypothetical protein
MQYAHVKYISPLYSVGWNASMNGVFLDRLLENLYEEDPSCIQAWFRRYDLVAGYVGAIHWMDKSDRHMLT